MSCNHHSHENRCKEGNKSDSHCHQNENGCDGCGQHNHEPCPLCNKNGIPVQFSTVVSLTKTEFKDDITYYEDQDFFLCKSRTCKVSYYTSNGARLFTDQLNVPIWFKGKPKKYIVCYCKDITLNDILDAVANIPGEVSIDAVCRYLEKPVDVQDCLHRNPTGTCCTPLFNNAIRYAIERIGSGLA